LRRELERDRPVVALMQFREGTVHALTITAVDTAEQVIGYSALVWASARFTRRP
jgi:hypothetical protein